MRKVAAFLLTAIICFNLFGFYALFILKQAEIKEEMSETIIHGDEANERETWLFGPAEFATLEFSDYGKELCIHGKLYDVVSIEKRGTQNQVVVEFDQKETSLISTFTQLWSQQQEDERNSSPLKTVISHFQQDYVSGSFFSMILFSGKQTSGILHAVFFHTSFFVSDNLTPPPQFFLV